MTPRDQQIIQRVQEGASVCAVAQEFGMASGTVVLLVRRHGGSFPEAEERNKKIMQRYREGVPKRQIAQEMGVTIKQVDGAFTRPLGRRGVRPPFA